MQKMRIALNGTRFRPLGTELLDGRRAALLKVLPHGVVGVPRSLEVEGPLRLIRRLPDLDQDQFAPLHHGLKHPFRGVSVRTFPEVEAQPRQAVVIFDDPGRSRPKGNAFGGVQPNPGSVRQRLGEGAPVSVGLEENSVLIRTQAEVNFLFGVVGAPDFRPPVPAVFLAGIDGPFPAGRDFLPLGAPEGGSTQ